MAMRVSTTAWLVMIALTAATALALNLGASRAAPVAWIGAIAAVTFVKGRYILLDFLELRRAGNWRRAFVIGLAAAITVVAAGLVIGSG